MEKHLVYETEPAFDRLRNSGRKSLRKSGFSHIPSHTVSGTGDKVLAESRGGGSSGPWSEAERGTPIPEFLCEVNSIFVENYYR